ncbi:MAG TPA: hypothetical protein VL053_05570 [Arachidicoccus sp.]|nr:hypothetical protein [Arachidicoccus sp.]
MQLSVRNSLILGAAIALLGTAFTVKPTTWQSRFVKMDNKGHLTYMPDEQGNTIPDFSKVGYAAGDQSIPEVPVVTTVNAPASGFSDQVIQDAINRIEKKSPDAQGYRGTILLKKGTYKILGTIQIHKSGIILRGESLAGNAPSAGSEKQILAAHGTKLIAVGNTQRTLIDVKGTGSIQEVPDSRVKISDKYVPVGTTTLHVDAGQGYKAGDSIIVFRPATEQWIKDIKMDQIVPRKGTRQWKTKDYNFQFERVITSIKGNTITIDNPVVMAMEDKYGGGYIYRYHYNGRIRQVGIENLLLESEYSSDTAEQHGWNAIRYDHIQNGWVKQVSARYFGYSCVNLGRGARNVTVLDCQCYDAKSIITGGRRYSFNNDGQLNLFMNCQTTEGRHDYVTGAQVRGPNAFVNCSASNTHADIGPHHRWAMGTLYDHIQTTGEINIQDRGNWGSGHGWSGVNQILWNCKAKSAVVQDPWASGHNYAIGLMGEIGKPRLKPRNQGIWEGQNQPGLLPPSLYLAQLKDRHNKKRK